MGGVLTTQAYEEFIKHNRLQDMVLSIAKSVNAGNIDETCNRDRLQPGDIMVAPSTDPGWTPLFLKAGAVVMETGGFLSHGAIVAREYGVPAVVNIPGVMRVIKDGYQVVVDGDEGKIFLR